MKTLLAALAMLTASSATTLPAPAPIGYRFDDVKRTVVLKTTSSERAASKGLQAQSGDKVHTGWFSYALIASEPHRAKFEIFSSTDVQLAGGAPGVILSLERGRLHAMFDKITGSEPRLVQTPGALLAVRGTQYTVAVDNAGRTTLDVWEGVVQVDSPLQHAPMFVRAGESSTFSRREPPAHPMKTPPDRGRDGENHPQGAPGQRDGSRDGQDGHDAHGGRPSPDGAAHPPPPPPPGHGGHG
jgi:hypothetical protein